MLFLGESFSWQQAAGMFLILLSVLSVVYDKQEKLTRFSKGELIGLLSVVLSGFALVNDKGIYLVTPLAPTLTALFMLPGFIGAIAQPKELLKVPIVLKNAKIIRELAILSLIWGAAAIAYYKSVVLSNSISLVVSISQLSVIVTVILGLLFLHERELAIEVTRWNGERRWSDLDECVMLPRLLSQRLQSMYPKLH